MFIIPFYLFMRISGLHLPFGLCWCLRYTYSVLHRTPYGVRVRNWFFADRHGWLSKDAEYLLCRYVYLELCCRVGCCQFWVICCISYVHPLRSTIITYFEQIAISICFLVYIFSFVIPNRDWRNTISYTPHTLESTRPLGHLSRHLLNRV